MDEYYIQLRYKTTTMRISNLGANRSTPDIRFKKNQTSVREKLGFTRFPYANVWF